MEYERWAPLYREILLDFGFSPERDVESARILERIIPPPDSALVRLGGLSGKKVMIVGPACSGEDVESVSRTPFPVIAADSAVKIFGKSGTAPTVIVTDLDGNLREIAKLASQGATVVVHAHGDNIQLLDEAKRFGDCILGTCQCRQFGKLFNFGGFTDGDRSAFLAERFGASSVELVGFDFERPAPKPGADPDVKLRKLAWAKRLLGSVKIPVTAGGQPFV